MNKHFVIFFQNKLEHFTVKFLTSTVKVASASLAWAYNCELTIGKRKGEALTRH